MNMLSKVSPGRSVPDDFNVIIEIASDCMPVKYELDKETGMLMVDRFMPTAMHYPCNYGFVPSTLSHDGDPVDVLVMTPFPVQPASLMRCRALGMLQMTDEAGEDCKVLAVPVEKACAQYAHMQSLSDVPQVTLDSIEHFFEHYKKLEPNKWVKIGEWRDISAAEAEIKESIARYNESAVVME